MCPQHICYRIEHRNHQGPITKSSEKDAEFREDNLINHLQSTRKKQTIIEEQNITDFEEPQMELLHLHHRLGHCSFHLIRALSIFGILPKKLALIRIPKCITCQFGSMAKRPWITKATANKIKVKQVLPPGDCVSVDQMQSSLPGLVNSKGNSQRNSIRQLQYSLIITPAYPIPICNRLSPQKTPSKPNEFSKPIALQT